MMVFLEITFVFVIIDKVKVSIIIRIKVLPYHGKIPWYGMRIFMAIAIFFRRIDYVNLDC